VGFVKKILYGFYYESNTKIISHTAR